MSEQSLALIIGASRGLGLGLVQEYLSRGWQVIATERQVGGSQGLAALACDALRVLPLDVTDEAGIAAMAQELGAATLDLLYINAGVSDDPSVPAGKVSTQEFDRVMQTNALAPMRLIETLAARVAPQGVLAVMSSGLGSVSMDPSAGYELYGASKAALNRMLRAYAARVDGGPTLLAVMPGWVQTDMGGTEAPLDVATSTKGIADAIGARKGSGGLHFIDYTNAVLPW
jgi:NAD(P)-dependent dehydrogenase (short-subunit alcohol dehydrogenase family)